jgi:predicted enzyme related to lactoylglutathione lyase
MYGQLFGWTYAAGPPMEDGTYTLCMLGGRSAAGLAPLPPGAPFPSSWSVYFAVDDADAAIARVREHHGQLLLGPMDVVDEGRLVFCLDPTGASFGMWQPKKHTGAGVVAEPGAMIWAEVRTRDAAAAQRFYAAVFDLEPRSATGHGMDYWMLSRAGTPVCGVLQMNERVPADVAPHWMPFFAVAEADAAVARASQLGATVAVHSFDTPSGRIAAMADPWGAAFSVLQPARS